MPFLSVKSRITLGLVSMLTSTMLITIFLGIGPDAHKESLHGRAVLCESIALNFSILAQRGDLPSIEGVLKALVERQNQLLSAGIRRSDGTISYEVGEHTKHWKGHAGYSTETNVEIPLRSGGNKWGTVELRFTPIGAAGLLGYVQSPWASMIVIVAVVSYLTFYLYLGRVLKQLDPSNAIPKRVRSALDTLTEGLLVTDRKGRVVLANESFSKWAGKSSDALIGFDACNFAWRFDENNPGSPEFPWRTAIEVSEAQAQVYMQLEDREGNVLSLVANSSPVLGQDGKYRGVLTSFEDVTELQRSRVELSVARDQADAANEAKSNFLARMSHEIRTPMNAILGFTEILRRGFAADELQRQDYLHTIQNSGEHLLMLINDILDLSKIESGKMELEFSKYSLFEIIQQAMAIFQLKAEEKGLSFSFEAATRLPEMIVTDSVRFRQVIINLIGNAIKFTEKGGVKIVARMDDQANQRLVIEVVDTGIGISKEAIDRIFDPFSQEDTSITRRFGGTGLGLSICLHLAEKLGGGIYVSSVRGQGSTFSLAIDPGPLEDATWIDQASTARSTSMNLVDDRNITLPACRILVVDDGAANRQLVSVYLERAGATVKSASNGQEALDEVNRSKFDLILMDVHMPVMDGMETARRLRAAGFQLPVIALTGNVLQDDEDSCRKAGYSGFLTKPIRMNVLLETVREALKNTDEDNPPDSRLALNDVPSDVERLTAQRFHLVEKELLGEIVELGNLGSSTDPINSELPTEDEEIAVIVQGFVEHLRNKVHDFETKLVELDFDGMADEAHWLKGAGGSLGFSCFYEPAKELEAAAKEHNQIDCDSLVKQIVELVRRVRSPSQASQGQSLPC